MSNHLEYEEFKSRSDWSWYDPPTFAKMVWDHQQEKIDDVLKDLQIAIEIIEDSGVDFTEVREAYEQT